MGGPKKGEFSSGNTTLQVRILVSESPDQTSAATRVSHHVQFCHIGASSVQKAHTGQHNRVAATATKVVPSFVPPP